VGGGGFLILLIVFGAVWLLFLMPARRRRAQHEAMQDTVDVGDEIITAGGLHGTIVEMGDTTVRVEIAPSVVATLDRRAVAAVATEVEVEDEAEDGAEHGGPVEAADTEPGAETSSEPR
jgi:preprotein translocase subunit YajC